MFSDRLPTITNVIRSMSSVIPSASFAFSSSYPAMGCATSPSSVALNMMKAVDIPTSKK